MFKRLTLIVYMKIVSIDVGIKNLAICIIESVESVESVGSVEPDKNFNILYWNIINPHRNLVYFI